MRSQSVHRRVAGLGWGFVFVAALLSAPAAAPDKFEKGKVNGPLSNMAEFARAFDCPMARAQEERPSVW